MCFYFFDNNCFKDVNGYFILWNCVGHRLLDKMRMQCLYEYVSLCVIFVSLCLFIDSAKLHDSYMYVAYLSTFPIYAEVVRFFEVFYDRTICTLKCSLLFLGYCQGGGRFKRHLRYCTILRFTCGSVRFFMKLSFFAKL